MQHLLYLTRAMARVTGADTAKKNLRTAIDRATPKNGGVTIRRLEVRTTEGGLRATATFAATTTTKYELYLEELKSRLLTQFDPPWLIATEDDVVDAPDVAGEEKIDVQEVPTETPVGEINLNLPSDTFSRIYGRDAQIRRVLDALSLGKETGWRKRKHTLLSGPPGCGKTELMLTLAKAIGKEGEAWIWFDATSTTKAGAIEMIINAKVIPPVLFVEEIEKTAESSLRWLLGVMDSRGDVRRTNYRVGNQHKQVRLSVVATANNTEILKAMDAGALYSRFANRIHCPRPDRPILQQILTREVQEMDHGNPQWVEETLKFGYDELEIEDPRELINMALCGRDRLLDGTYQKDFLATSDLTKKEQL